MDEEAKTELKKGNFDNALMIYERLLLDEKCQKFEVLLGKARSLVGLNRFIDAVDCYKNALCVAELKETDILPFIDGLINKVSTGAASQHKVNTQIHEPVLCTICSGILLDPTTLPCGHTNCQKCIERLQTKVCKVCKKPFCSYKVKTNVVLQEITNKHFPNKVKASILRFEGNELLKEKKNEQALENYLEALKLDPINPLLWSNISHVRTQLGRFEEGLESAVKVCELYPKWPKGYYRKGCALIGLQKHTEAAVAFLQCLSNDLDNILVKKAIVELIHEMFCRLRPDETIEGGAGEKYQLHELIEMIENLKRIDSQELEEEGKQDPPENNPEQDAKPWKICGTDDFECTLCCRLFYEPVTTPCGHMFCRSCLNRSLDHNPDCPICRSSLSQVLATKNQSITVAVEEIMQTHLTELYEERKKQHLEEMERLASIANTGDDIPIFVCTLAYPMMPCPLHIFEPRYRLMVRQCMESGSRQFGMCSYDEDHGFSEFGTMLEINDVQVLVDGRSLVDTVGGRRFKVLSKGMRDGYRIAKVEWLADEPVAQEEEAELKRITREVYDEAKRWFGSLPLLMRRRITNSLADIPSWQEDAHKLPHGPQWLWWLIAVSPFDPKTQASMLGLKSLKERLLVMKRTLASFL